MVEPSGTIVETFDCASVQEFLEAIDPRQNRFASISSPGWVFRGQSDESYSLIPSSLRRDSNWEKLAWIDCKTNKLQETQERYLLAEFLETSDAMGLHIPEDGQTLRAIMDTRAKLPGSWPPKEIWSLMGLAQHNGVPTRLLDWSRNALKATLFAAQSAAEKNVPGKRLVLWALNAGQLKHIREVPPPFALIVAPASTNANLHAQEGLFTLGHFVTPDDSKIDCRPFDALLEEWVQKYQGKTVAPWFYRFTLPHSLAEEIEFELSLLGISRAKLFPGFSGVVLQMKDRARLSRIGGPARSWIEEARKRFFMSFSARINPAEFFLSQISAPPREIGRTNDVPLSASIKSYAQLSTLEQKEFSFPVIIGSTSGDISNE